MRRASLRRLRSAGTYRSLQMQMIGRCKILGSFLALFALALPFCLPTFTDLSCSTEPAVSSPVHEWFSLVSAMTCFSSVVPALSSPQLLARVPHLLSRIYICIYSSSLITSRDMPIETLVACV